jgi:hypothetical protein
MFLFIYFIYLSIYLLPLMVNNIPYWVFSSPQGDTSHIQQEGQVSKDNWGAFASLRGTASTSFQWYSQSSVAAELWNDRSLYTRVFRLSCVTRMIPRSEEEMENHKELTISKNWVFLAAYWTKSNSDLLPDLLQVDSRCQIALR